MATERISRTEATDLEIAPWDALAEQRASDIDSGVDLSFKYVLKPSIADAVDRVPDWKNLIDIGCGTGRLLSLFANAPGELHAIDPSVRSVELALSHAHRLAIPATISPSSVQEYAASRPGEFDVAVANMVLQDVVDIQSFLQSSSALLRTYGTLVVTITHPFFWAQYWRYDKESWFKYDHETFIKSEFRISNRRSGVNTLHVHRSLELYWRALERAGFIVRRISEPLMPERIQRESGVRWDTPHFLVITAEKQTSQRE